MRVDTHRRIPDTAQPTPRTIRHTFNHRLPHIKIPFPLDAFTPLQTI
ncbi:hypothetical protein [Gimesia alba]|nr:hypothetical protein [Gimesia alba]